MNLAATELLTTHVIENNKGPIIEAADLGVKYILGSKREDLQSLSYEFLFKKNKNKKEFWALKGVSFTGHRGEILGIIGSNGAGKTTLCRVLSGLLKPDIGTIAVNGSVTALFSLGTGFNQQLTGRENIFLNGLMLGLSKKDVANIMPEIITFSGLGRFIEEPLKRYSKGMIARLGFSIAAMVQPEILIIDEALAAGDLAFSEKAAEKMQELVGKAKLVIIVSHKIDFIKKYCTRALWIDGGMVKIYGEPEMVTEEYTNSIPESSRSKRKNIKLPETNPSVFKSIAISANKLGLKYILTSNKNSLKNDDKQEKSFFKKKEPFWALSDVSFTVNAGEVIGIIGANGSGKTTLCRVLTKILKHDAGNLTVNGDTTALLSFGTGFNQQLSGKDNIFLNGLMLGITQKRLAEIYNEIVSFSGLIQFINMPVKHYSSGMRARLGFSIASAIEPDIFIIDEALNAGDAAFSEKASARIQQLIVQAKAVIVVTHSFAFVEKVCTRAIWIEKGKLAFDGKPADAIAKYKKANKKQNKILPGHIF